MVVVAPRTVLGGFNLPVIPTSQKHLCKQFLRDPSQGMEVRGKKVMLGRKKRQPQL